MDKASTRLLAVRCTISRLKNISAVSILMSVCWITTAVLIDVVVGTIDGMVACSLLDRLWLAIGRVVDL